MKEEILVQCDGCNGGVMNNGQLTHDKGCMFELTEEIVPEFNKAAYKEFIDCEKTNWLNPIEI